MAETQDDFAVLPISVALPDGSPLVLDPPVTSADQVSELRNRVANAICIHPEQVLLVHGSSELLDDTQPLGAMFPEGQAHEEQTVAAIRMPCRTRPSGYDEHIHYAAGGGSDLFATMVSQRVAFPPPQGININMMPFIPGKRASLPDEYSQYWPVIYSCEMRCADMDKVCYLTIMESYVEQGHSQRRPGLHVESPRVVLKEGGRCFDQLHGWGFSMGLAQVGGLYMGSNVTRSCQIWDCKLTEAEKVVGLLGDVEHLRETLGQGTYMNAGEIWWLTDTTPHESLPLEEGAYRQYFRLVTSSVGVWYAKHSTPNRLGVEPDPAVTKIVTHDKFEEAGLSQAFRENEEQQE
mmetsp:Transcript_18155/g.49811  ORF Transcript_18155/g.49811 Transcript_18155/m.49811 type:complete len:349 (+) Transcript_18155:99-1145(+)